MKSYYKRFLLLCIIISESLAASTAQIQWNSTVNTGTYSNAIGYQTLPNPNDGLLNLTFSNHKEKNIKIYNAQGVMCFQAFNIRQPDYFIDMSSLNNGIYIVFLEIDNVILKQKIILKK